MSRRSYSGNAVSATLSSTIGSTDTSFSVSVATGWPTTNFVITIDTGGTEEKCLVGSRTGTALSSVTRGWEGTTAAGHSSGVTVKHTSSATDADEANAHVNATSGVHGLTGAVVGTTDTQTLTSKTLTAPVIGDFTNAGHTHAAAASGGNIPESSVTNLTSDLLARLKLGSTPTSSYTNGLTASNQLLWQAGTNVVTTNAGGGAAITYPAAFPNGVVTVIASAGDNSTAGLTVQVITSQVGTTQFGFQCFGQVSGPDTNSYNTIGTATVRINWIALGW